MANNLPYRNLDDDLAVTTDFRDVYAALLEKVLNTPKEQVLSKWSSRLELIN